MIGKHSIVGNFPIVDLTQAVEFLDHQRQPVKQSDRKPGLYPYFGANGQQGTIDGFIFDEPLVLLAEDGGLFDQPDRGIAYRISGKTWVNNHAHVLRPKTNVDINYLTRVLENYDVSPYLTGSTRAKLTKSGASRIGIPLPPLPEQRRIAAILDQADALRRQRRRAIEKLDSLSQSIFLDMFGDPRSSLTHPQFPLDDLSVRKGEYGANVPSCEYSKNLPRYIRITDINDSGELNNDKVSPGKSRSAWKKFFLNSGDLLFARSGATVGKTYLYQESDGLCVYAGYLIRFRLNQSRIDPRFAFAFTKTDAYLDWVTSKQRTVAQPNINAKQYGSELQVPLPPLPLQQEFARRVEKVEKLKAAQRRELAKLDELFAALQQRAFKGEL
ncbi:restriction endonuclease subunit S [bacterium]|nr:restriction endonuclease subunit S [bacterium]